MVVVVMVVVLVLVMVVPIVNSRCGSSQCHLLFYNPFIPTSRCTPR